METRLKLKEAEYFLQKLLHPKEDPNKNPDVFRYHLSAFLSAWRSVFDIMLYDLALHYFPSLSRDDKIMYSSFRIVAKAQNHTKALQFIDWYDKKFRSLRDNPLWIKRITALHKGYPPIRIQVFVSTSSASYVTIGGKIPVETEIGQMWESEIGNILEECKEGFRMMQEVVEEAESEFDVEL